MAPLVLPKDETRLMGEAEQSIKAADEAQSTLPLPPSQLPKVKAEPDQAEEEARSALSTPMPSSSRSSTHPPQDGSTDEEQDTKKPIVVKSEQVAEGFMQDQVSLISRLSFQRQFTLKTITHTDCCSCRAALCVPIPSCFP